MNTEQFRIGTEAQLPTALVTLLPGATMPAPGTSASVGFDVCVSVDASIDAHGHQYVPTGLIINAPKGHFVLVAARSSLIKRGLILANGVGIVDPDFCGPADEIKLSLYNLSGQTVHLKAGDRLAQALFLPIPAKPIILQAPAVGESRGGFGSTGDRAFDTGDAY
jgi:dUTP pyrophosphatase